MSFNKPLSPWIGYTLLLSGILVLLSCMFPVEFMLYLVAGWFFFLARVLPQTSVNTNGVLTGIVGLVGFAVGLHMFLRWFAGAASRPWRWRWTLGLVALVILMFAAGTAAVGCLHQVGWLVTSPEPLLSRGLRDVAARTTSANNLKQMTLGLHNFAGAHDDRFPPGYTTDRSGQLLHGWQAAILPYIEYQQLYKNIHFDRPWDAWENRPPLQSKVKPFLYSYQSLPEEDGGGYALSHYAGNVRAMPPQTGLRLPGDFLDGTSNTILMGEVLAGFRPWGHPLNLRDPAQGIRKSADAFAGPWPGGATQFAFADGSVRPIRNDISPSVLKALATPAGGEDVSHIDW